MHRAHSLWPPELWWRFHPGSVTPQTGAWPGAAARPCGDLFSEWSKSQSCCLMRASRRRRCWKRFHPVVAARLPPCAPGLRGRCSYVAVLPDEGALSPGVVQQPPRAASRKNPAMRRVTSTRGKCRNYAMGSSPVAMSSQHRRMPVAASATSSRGVSRSSLHASPRSSHDRRCRRSSSMHRRYRLTPG